MNNCINKEVDSFIAEIKKNMLCPVSQKKTIINDFENSIFDFVESNNITDISDVYAHFGEPKDIAQQLLEDIEPSKIKKAINIKRVVLCALIFLALIFAISMILIVIDNHFSQPAYFSEDIKHSQMYIMIKLQLRNI